jgi:DNA invertase Pin-like site-specific DNA recombinase
MSTTNSALLSRFSKVQSWHLDRWAIVYVRQSSVQQVLENRESTERQYALVDRAIDCGWPRDRVLVIDEDQGKSSSTSEGRLGFQRLLVEVGLDHVGLILGIEMSRLARSCKDWHQLLELCAIFRTLLGDQGGLYDPTDPNDRLLLGLKGTMSEAELHVLRGRLRQGVLNKARRGELFLLPPIGYVRSPQGGIELDPDEQVRGTVSRVFELFDRLGSARAVTKALLDQRVSLGVRLPSGPQRRQIEWRPAAMSTVSKMLKHPIYAGIYVFGRTQADPRQRGKDNARPAKAAVEPERYHAYLPGRCPAYITAEQYEANQQKLKDNRARTESRGAARGGPSLLAGLVRCGRCHHRMQVAYSGFVQTTPIHLHQSAQRARQMPSPVSWPGTGPGGRGGGIACLGSGGRRIEPRRHRGSATRSYRNRTPLAAAFGTRAVVGGTDRTAISGGRAGKSIGGSDA